MRRVAAVIFSGLLTLAGISCSGGVADSPDRSAANGSLNDSVNTAPAASENAPASPVNGAVSDNTVIDAVNARRNQKLEAMRRPTGNSSKEQSDIEDLIKRSTRPAPDDSVFGVALGDVVVERRTFLKHPVLAKIEKVTDGAKSSVKIQTTDGRLIELPGDAIDNLSVARAAAIIRAAGLPSVVEPFADRKPRAERRN